MKTSGMTAILFFVGILLLAYSESRSVRDFRVRDKRQTGDLIASEYFAVIGLGRVPHGCREVGCGLINIAESGKRKRSGYVPSEEEKRQWDIMEALVEKEAADLEQQMKQHVQ